MEFSRHEYWSGLSFPSEKRKSKDKGTRALSEFFSKVYKSLVNLHCFHGTRGIKLMIHLKNVIKKYKADIVDGGVLESELRILILLSPSIRSKIFPQSKLQSFSLVSYWPEKGHTHTPISGTELNFPGATCT